MSRWHIALLVSAAIAISYLDRQTLPVAIGAIRDEIPISNSVKAFLDSAFLACCSSYPVSAGSPSVCVAATDNRSQRSFSEWPECPCPRFSCEKTG